MNRKNVNYLKLKDVINATLTDYTDDIREKIEQAASNVAEEGILMLNEIEMPSATSSGDARPLTRRTWSKYSHTWKVKDLSNVFQAHKIIYNYKNYRLTHLLEYGHATRNGTTTRAFVHLKPIEERLASNFLKSVRMIIDE